MKYFLMPCEKKRQCSMLFLCPNSNCQLYQATISQQNTRSKGHWKDKYQLPTSISCDSKEAKIWINSTLFTILATPKFKAKTIFLQLFRKYHCVIFAWYAIEFYCFKFYSSSKTCRQNSVKTLSHKEKYLHEKENNKSILKCCWCCLLS